MHAQLVGVALVAVVGLGGPPAPHAALGPSTSVVVSQFGAGYIELHNMSSSTVDMDGWSVQTAPEAFPGQPYAVTPLSNVSIGPGAYFLVQEAGASGLPTPDATGT